MRLFPITTDGPSALWINLDSVVQARYIIPDGKPGYLSLTLQNGSYDVTGSVDMNHIALILGITLPPAAAAKS
jgi:hypothetical protein